MSMPLIGHRGPIARLSALAARDRLPHALLFTGPEGIGKTLAAHWLAAHLLCAGASERPCGRCDSCRQAGAESHPDLTIVRVAGGRKEIGVDAIRQLKRAMCLRSVTGRGRIGIVEDAERMSVSAQNAILKTLEEPPDKAVLVLTSAAPGALLSTVRSRCQRILLQPLADEEVARVLQERCGVPEEEAGQLVSLAEGSPGRALRLREIWSAGERAELLSLLAELDPARYGSILQLSRMLGGSEQEIGARLEMLLAHYHDAAVESARRGGAGSADAALSSFAIVDEGLAVLRRRNPNRTLLAEALALRLARGA